MPEVPRKARRNQRQPRPSVRSRFVARAKTLQTDPAFSRTVARLRRAWNHTYPDYALGEPAWIPKQVPNMRLFCVPPVLARIKEDSIKTGTEPPQEAARAWARWERLVLQRCEWGWPSVFYPNWLGQGSHPAVMFASASLVWRIDSVPPEVIVTGGPVARPLLFDPEDEMSHPAVAFWVAYGGHVVASVREAIERGEHMDHSWLEKTIVSAAKVGLAEREQRMEAGVQQPFWYVPIFPGMRSTDRDALMASIMEAEAHRYGDHPLRTHMVKLAARGKSQTQIAKLLGVDRSTVSRLLDTT